MVVQPPVFSLLDLLWPESHDYHLITSFLAVISWKYCYTKSDDSSTSKVAENHRLDH